jgi:hypothetical protein
LGFEGGLIIGPAKVSYDQRDVRSKRAILPMGCILIICGFGNITGKNSARPGFYIGVV